MSQKTNRSISSNKSQVKDEGEPQRKRNKLFAYKVPKEIYEKALQEINSPDPNINEVAVRAFCRNHTYNFSTSVEDPNSKGNLMEGAKQALEDRNFRALYEIINKALEMKLISLFQNLKEVSSLTFL